jgi:hypothetical protein
MSVACQIGGPEPFSMMGTKCAEDVAREGEEGIRKSPEYQTKVKKRSVEAVSQPVPLVEDVSPDVETKVDVAQLNPFFGSQQHAASSASHPSPSSHLSHSSQRNSPAPSPDYGFRH